MINPSQIERDKVLTAHFDGVSYYDSIEVNIGEFLMQGSEYVRGKQLLGLGMAFGNLLDLMIREGEGVIGMTVSVYIDDHFDTRKLSLMMTPEARMPKR